MLTVVPLSNRQVREASLAEIFGHYIFEDFAWGDYLQHAAVTLNMGLPAAATNHQITQMMALLNTTTLQLILLLNQSVYVTKINKLNKLLKHHETPFPRNLGLYFFIVIFMYLLFSRCKIKRPKHTNSPPFLFIPLQPSRTKEMMSTKSRRRKFRVKRNNIIIIAIYCKRGHFFYHATPKFFSALKCFSVSLRSFWGILLPAKILFWCKLPALI